MRTINYPLAGSVASWRRRWNDPLAVGVAVAVLVRIPTLLILGLFVPLFARWSRQRRQRLALRRAVRDVSIAGRIVLVGLTGGLPLPASLEGAAAEVGPLVAAELNGVLRAARREGMAAALAASSGPLTRPLFSRLALAQASGAPMVDGVAAFLSEVRSIRRAEALESARRLPVTLMIPLGLLILPGFVVLFVGPIVLTSMRELFVSLP